MEKYYYQRKYTNKYTNRDPVLAFSLMGTH